MISFDIAIDNIRLRVICEDYKKDLIVELMTGHSYIKEPIGVPTYTLILTDENIKTKSGEYFKMIDEWYDNATCDVWIDNANKMVYMANINASSTKYRNLLIQYFTCNLFNRLLEEQGYIAFHSSAIDKNGHGVAFIGPRNSGKTNCMLNMMTNGYNSVTNDKLGIQYNDLNLNGYGVAQDVSIRMSLAFRSQPQNQKYIEYAIKQNVKLLDENKLEGNNIHLESTELARINNVLQVPKTIIEHIIFPKYDSNIKEVKLRRVQNDEAKELIMSQRLPIVHPTTSFFSNVKTLNNKTFDDNKTIEEMLKLENYEIIQGEHSTESYVKALKKIMR